MQEQRLLLDISLSINIYKEHDHLKIMGGQLSVKLVTARKKGNYSNRKPDWPPRVSTLKLNVPGIIPSRTI